MQRISSLTELDLWKGRLHGETLGFVPTMGALHEGHLSLVQLSLDRGAKTLVSIYVNPTQFNNPEDLAKYPNTLEKDLEMLETMGCDAVFLPTAEMLYPEGLKSRVFSFGCLDLNMEGAGRPGHFEGMATVVTKFFELIQPDFAIFGEKDYQQLCIVRHVVTEEHWPVEIVPGPIVREADGLAMSSRNLRLSEVERQEAATIYAVLSKACAEAERFEGVAELKSHCVEALNAVPSLTVEYIECCDEKELQPVAELDPKTPTRLFAAVHCGNVRLIDNLPLF
ncbi:MAG: pantoate--beta-alanine ligase [Schleiferiaceae bacterium]|jgi:pantoate--beta-alanine ligase